MDFRQAISAVEESEAFKQWRPSHPDAFLAHAFAVKEPEHWEIGYYDEKVMSIFSIEKEVKCSETNEVLRTAHDIMPLDSAKVGSDEQALERAGQIARENYPQEQVQKTFFVIQQLPSGPVFNITFFTKSFKTINIKLSAADYSLLKQSIDKLFEFG